MLARAMEDWPHCSAAGRPSSAPRCFLLGGEGCERERVHVRPQLIREDLVDAALPRDAAEAGELRRDDLDPKMRLALRTGTGMARMAVRFIDDREADRTQRAPQLALDDF